MIYISKLEKTIKFECVTKSQLLTQIFHNRVFNKKATKIYGISINTFGKVWVTDIHDHLITFRILYDESERLTRAKSEKFQMPRINDIRRSDSQKTYNKDRIHLRMFPFTDQIKDWAKENTI